MQFSTISRVLIGVVLIVLGTDSAVQSVHAVDTTTIWVTSSLTGCVLPPHCRG
ncbi:MAG: hypothetical protein ACP5OR_04415 [Candidatus Dormibacteria bacterium]